ncbi:Aste57867_1573 [Aphanomyces stellatus]|uniref:Aste57867_1573 protein n=1 Tax=Aphanomyces stellatus TaxID=120398 RepID=A0A485KAZ1_9STRA|nr:hypothetical protein As57867_001572 [Aphanomyces stellatus]VFT78786.1 Aste57867_1573 [Aphanomyces stellatus]
MDKVFDAKSKAQAKDLIHQIEESMNILLKNLTWLDDATRQVGLEKVAKIGNFIGGPDSFEPSPNFNLGPRCSLLSTNIPRISTLNPHHFAVLIGFPVSIIKHWMV